MKNTILISTILFLFTSCYSLKESTNSYINNVPNVNMFEEVGDMQVSGQAGLNHEEIQVGCAVDSRIAVSGSIYTGLGGQEYFDLSVGYWKQIDKEIGSYFAVDFGYGEARVQSENFSLYTGISLNGDYLHRDISYKRAFVQPVFYLTGPQRVSKIAFGVRLSKLYFDNYKYLLQHYNGHEIVNQDTKNFTGRSNEWVFMYSTNHRKFLEFNFQLVIAERYAKDVNLWQHGQYRPNIFYINTGIRLNLNYLLKL